MKPLVSLAALLSLVHAGSSALAQPEPTPSSPPTPANEPAPSGETEPSSKPAPANAAEAGNTAPSPKLSAPQLLESVAPVYPERQREHGRDEAVVLLLTIDETGAVVDVAVSESAGQDFDQAALAVVPKLRFSAATRDGTPVKARIPFRVAFVAPTVSEGSEPKPQPQPASETPAPAASALPSAGVEVDEGLEISVEGERPQLEPTRQEISGTEVTRIPGTNGDALGSIGNMPGVARTPGFDSALIIRGSGPRDSGIFAEGVSIPMAYHFDGVSSVLPSELLERIDFYPGNFGPQYGRAMGGVVSLEVRSPRKDRLGGLLQVDLLDGRVLAETPINDSTRILVGGRRSWVDSWLGPIMKAGGLGVALAPVYYDAQVLVEHDLSNKTRLRLFAFGAEDRMRLANPAPSAADPSDGGEIAVRTGFWRSQLSLDTRPSPGSSWVSSVSVGQDREQFVIGSIDALTTSLNVAARSHLRSELTSYLTAVAGLDAQWNHYRTRWRYPAMDFESESSAGPLFGRPTVEISANPDVVRPAAYALLEVSPHRRVKLLPGVRTNYDSDTRDVTVEPRFSARYDVVAGPLRTTLKGGAGVYYQPPDPYESVKPFGTPGINSPYALHYSFGVEQELSRPVEVSVEGFYKDLDDLVVSAPAADSAESGTTYQNIGTGRAYGGELLVRYKPLDRFFGWIAYTLSRSERKDGPDSPTVPFDYDQTHILTALGSYKLGRGWELGARFRYVTGTPYTPYVGGVVDLDAGAYAPVVSSQVNSARGETFHQLDVRVDKTWRFRTWQLGAYLDLQNAYNHRSSDQLTYNYDYSQTGRIPGLPVMPIFGLRGEI